MKRVLVIGASSGIGRALVVGLRAKGIEAVACARRGELLASMIFLLVFISCIYIYNNV